MLTFAETQRNKTELLALTGLTLTEYQVLLPEFERAYRQRYAGDSTRAGQPRQRTVGGGAVGRLDKLEDKLLFSWVYQKTYPLQVMLGQLFAMGPSAANPWIHRLLPVLQAALTAKGCMPERQGPQFASAERQRREPPDYSMDGTERRRHRPTDPEKQALHDSGQKKLHTDKNIVITHPKTNRVCFLSPTRPGTVHAKKLADPAHSAYPRQAVVHKDTAFQGDEPKVQHTHQPKKTAWASTDHSTEKTQSQTLAHAGARRTRHQWYQTLTLCPRHFAQHTRHVFRRFHGDRFSLAQPTRRPAQATFAALT